MAVPKPTSPIEEQLANGRERFVEYVRRRVDDPELAEDIVQESLLRALRAAPALRDEERLVPWFYRMLQNAIVDAYRRRGVERRHVAQVEFEEPADEAADEAVLCECLGDVLPTIRPEYADVVRAVDLGGEAPEAATRRLGISATNLKVRRHRARQALRKRLEETYRICAEHHCLDCSCKST